MLEFAQKNPNFTEKIEGFLKDIVENKSSKSMTNLKASSKSFLTSYVYEHFKLDMCNYRSKLGNQMVFTDINWKYECRVPDILVSKVVDLINKGIMEANNAEYRASVF